MSGPEDDCRNSGDLEAEPSPGSISGKAESAEMDANIKRFSAEPRAGVTRTQVIDRGGEGTRAVHGG
jgi:hypothetical protein